MSYTKHTWTTDEYITADKLNNIENGIEESANNRLVINMEQVSDSVFVLDKNYNEISTAIENGIFPFILDKTHLPETYINMINIYGLEEGTYYVYNNNFDMFFTSDSATGVLTFRLNDDYSGDGGDVNVL